MRRPDDIQKIGETMRLVSSSSRFRVSVKPILGVQVTEAMEDDLIAITKSSSKKTECCRFFEAEKYVARTRNPFFRAYRSAVYFIFRWSRGRELPAQFGDLAFPVGRRLMGQGLP